MQDGNDPEATAGQLTEKDVMMAIANEPHSAQHWIPDGFPTLGTTRNLFEGRYKVEI